MSKQYGLTFPKKNLSAPKAGNIFGNDEDSEEDGTNLVKKTLKAENEKNKVKKQVENARKKAIEEDPTIYMYDEVYDEMEHAKEKEKETIRKIEKKPKYIHDLLSAAEQRKKEQELRKDRIIQKEIEEEETKFPDKERFVTSGYKKKLEEQKKFEEEQKRKDSLSIEVTKQKDMSGFYRHLYRQTVEKNTADVDIISTEQKESKNEVKIDPNIDKDDPIPTDSSSDSDNESPKDTIIKDKIKKSKTDRQYRKRVHEDSHSEDDIEIPVEKEEKSVQKEEFVESKKENLKEVIKKSKHSEDKENKNLKESSENEIKNQVDKNDVKSSSNSATNDESEKVSKDTPKPIEEKKKINIWEKRTVGPVFEAALQRYLIRKEERLAGV